MLDRRRDERRTPVERPRDRERERVALGAAGCEDDLLGGPGADQGGDPLPGLLHRPPGRSAGRMNGRRISPRRRQERFHRGRDAGVHGSRRVVVEVDHERILTSPKKRNSVYFDGVTMQYRGWNANTEIDPYRPSPRGLPLFGRFSEPRLWRRPAARRIGDARPADEGREAVARRRRAPDDEGGEARLRLPCNAGSAHGLPGRVLGASRAGRTSSAVRPELQESLRIAPRDRQRRLRRPQDRRRPHRSRPRRADERSQDRMRRREHLSADRDLDDAPGRRAPGSPEAHLLSRLRVRPSEALDTDPRAGSSPAAARAPELRSPVGTAFEREPRPPADVLRALRSEGQGAHLRSRMRRSLADDHFDEGFRESRRGELRGLPGGNSVSSRRGLEPLAVAVRRRQSVPGFFRASHVGPLSGAVGDSLSDIEGREGLDRGRGGPARDRGRKEDLPVPSVSEPANAVSRRILADP